MAKKRIKNKPNKGTGKSVCKIPAVVSGLEEAGDVAQDYIPLEELKQLRALKFSPSQIREITFAVRDKLDYKRIVNINYNMPQMACIRKGMEWGLDVDVYAREYYSARQMLRLRKALQYGKDTSFLEDARLKPAQMDEILAGLLSEVDVSLYANAELTAQSMNMARRTLEARKGLSALPKSTDVIAKSKGSARSSNKTEANARISNLLKLTKAQLEAQVGLTDLFGNLR